MTDTSSWSLPDNTVYAGFLIANSSSKNTLLHYQPPEQAKTEYVLRLSRSTAWVHFSAIPQKESGTEYQDLKGFNDVHNLHAHCP